MCSTPASHAALKGALVAAAQGRWSDHSLKVAAVLPDGGAMPLELELERFEFDGEPAVRLKVPTQRHDSVSIAQQLEEALRSTPAPGCCSVARFSKPAARSSRSRSRAVCARSCTSNRTSWRHSSATSDRSRSRILLDAVGAMLRGLLQPGDLGGRLTGRGYAVLIERGNARDLDAFIRRLVRAHRRTRLPGRRRSLSITASVGVALCAANEPLPGPLNVAIRSQRAAAAAGGNRTLRHEDRDESRPKPRPTAPGRTQIKSALMANRFRLVQQPIASLVGEDRAMFDLVVRMLDDKRPGSAAVRVPGRRRSHRPA